MVPPGKDLRPALTALATQLGGRFQWARAGDYAYFPSFEVVHGGVAVTCDAAEGGKGALVGVDFSVPQTRPLTVCRTELRGETRLDRLTKSLRIDREFQTGDTAFDRAVYIDSDASDAVLARAFASEEMRNAVRRLLAVGPITLTISGGLRVRVLTKRFAETAMIARAIAELVELGRICDRPRVGPYGRGGQEEPSLDDRPLPRRSLRGAIALGLLGVPIVAAYAEPHVGDPFGSRMALYALGLTLATWLVFVFLFALLLRGRSSSFVVIVLAACAWLLVDGPFVFVSMQQLDALLDDGPSTAQPGVALFVPGKKGPGATRVRVGAETAMAPDGFTVTSGEGEVPVVAITRPGAFGVPWLASVRRR